MSKVIWRIEKDGQGPYNYCFSEEEDFDGEKTDLLNEMIWEHNKSNEHPEPTFPTDEPEMYFCGCLSKNQLEKWFYGFFEQLLEIGFEIVMYIVPDEFVIEDVNQVLFMKEKAICQKTFM